MRPFLHNMMFAAALTLATRGAAFADDAVDFPPVSDNAALQYWQAFAMLPAFDATQEKLLENWATAPLDGAVEKLLDESKTSLMFLKRGAQLRNCDWGFDYHDGASLFLPHLAKARTLARVAALDARRAFEAQDYDRAQGDAYAMMALARQVGSDHTLVSVLVCHAIEGMTIDLVSPYVLEAYVSYDDAVAKYNSLPPRPQLEQAVVSEQRLATAMINQVKEAERQRPGSWREAWKSMLGPDSPDPFSEAQNLEEFLKPIDAFMPLYGELRQLATLPPADFDAQYPEFAKRAAANNTIARLLLPAMDKTVATLRYGEARAALLLAAIAVVDHGPEKLADIKDPFGDGPFGYRKLDTGFELSSQLLEDGKPVTLTIGQKKAAPTP